MSRSGATLRVAASASGAPARAPAPASNARAEASRRNGARSRGPKTPEGKARSAQNALKHGMRAHKHVLLPQEDAAAFRALEAALRAELAPEGALQTVLARRIAIAAWRLERADRMETEALEVRSYDGANPGVALIRDGNGTRAFETLMRYRSAAMAEFTRALRILKALQAERAEPRSVAAELLEAPQSHPRAPAASHPAPNQPEPRPTPSSDHALEYLPPERAGPGRALHEPAARWTPNEPERANQRACLATPRPE